MGSEAGGLTPRRCSKRMEVEKTPGETAELLDSGNVCVRLTKTRGDGGWPKGKVNIVEPLSVFSCTFLDAVVGYYMIIAPKER